MEKEEDIVKISGLVPEFWNDLIARIIPGFAIIATTVPSALADPTWSIGKVFGILIFSYVVGIISDVFGEFAHYSLWRLHKPELARNRQENTRKAIERGAIDKAVFLKMRAETVLFRTLFFLSLFHTILAVTRQSDPKFIEYIESYPLGVCVLMNIVLPFCWYRLDDYTNRRFILKEYSSEASKNITEDSPKSINFPEVKENSTSPNHIENNDASACPKTQNH